MMMFDPFLLVITGVFMLIGMFISSRLKSVFKEYSKEPLASGLSGKEVAEKMLRDNDILDVQVTSVNGQLTDHYNPATKTVNLSVDVYNGRNISSAAVAAHECGHAVQHAHAYAWLQMRSALVPVVQIGSTLMNLIVVVGMFGAFAIPQMGNTILLIFIGGQSLITLFSLVTLPVEYDASNRALVWLNTHRIAYGEQHEKAEIALKWAARTYLVAALASIATLLYFVLRYMGNRD